MKQHRIIRFSGLFLLLGVLFGLAACNDWTEMEAVDNNVKKPWEQDPALWAEYTAALRDYKKSEHFIVYARLHNSPEPAASEKDFMRCLPDSLDIVALTNADNFSRYDAEDMAVMREKGTKVLWQVDYAGRAAEFADAAKLGAWLDRVVSSVAANGIIIGWYFFGEQNVKALFGHKAVKAYAAIVVVCIVIGSALHVDLVWNLSDLFNGLMVFPNLIALLALSGLVAKAAHDKDIMK